VDIFFSPLIRCSIYGVKFSKKQRKNEDVPENGHDFKFIGGRGNNR